MSSLSTGLGHPVYQQNAKLRPAKPVRQGLLIGVRAILAMRRRHIIEGQYHHAVRVWTLEHL